MSEHRLRENHSSEYAKTTRVKPRKKEPRITVGITISPHLVEEARKRNLNISRIAEQALQSILEYYPQQTETESSINLLSRGSFPKESRAGSLARLGHLLDVQKVAGSSPVRPTKTDKSLDMNEDCIKCGNESMPSEIFDVEKFVGLSEGAEYCAVKRLRDVVKLKLRTSKRLYTLKVEPAKAEEVIKKLQCEIQEI